jgi:DNA (cytosine-5)-methyltransferase 1
LAHTNSPRLERRVGSCVPERAPQRTLGAIGASVDDPMRGRHRPQAEEIRPGWITSEFSGWWGTEPDVGRVAHGVPARVDRLRGLGNAVVPQVAEWIGSRLP